MITMQDIREMDEEDIGLFVREECETIGDVTEVVDFAQELREYALDELDHREDGNVTRGDGQLD